MIKSSGQFISIGLAIYNQEKNIVKCIQSILSQTYVNFELLISDDCSTDDTIRICEDFSKRDKRIKLFKQKKNLGVSENFYFVFRKSRYKFFIWLSGDDYISKDYLENNINTLLANNNCVFAASPNAYVDENNSLFDISRFSITGKLFERGSKFLYLCFKATGCNFAIYKKEILESCADLKKRFLGHDWKVISHALSKGDFIRSEKGMVYLGKGGISSNPYFMEKEINNFLENFFPLKEFTFFFFNSFVSSKNILFSEKIVLFYKLFYLNIIIIINKFKNILRLLFLKRKDIFSSSYSQNKSIVLKLFNFFLKKT
jgi:glycosyltransferase involved in cell wall biosynthesis